MTEPKTTKFASGFPVCGTCKKIPYEVAEAAHRAYVKRYGNIQSLERIGERGGFYPDELKELIGYELD